MILAITVLAVFSNLLLGLFVYLQNPKSATNRLFFLLNISLLIWSIANYLSLFPSVGNEQILWIRLVLFFAIPITASFFLLMYVFPREFFSMNKGYFYAYLYLSVLGMVATISPFVFSKVVSTGNTNIPIIGPLMPYFALVIFGSISGGLYFLIRKFYHSQGIQRIQLQYILLGTTIMFALILFTIFVPVVFLGNTFFIPFAPLYTLVFIGFTSYAIIRHNFLDVRLVLARTVSYTLLLAILAVVYALLFAVLNSLFINATLELNTIISSTLLALIMSFLFQPLRRILEKFTNFLFYKDHYNTNTLLYKLTRIMASTLSLEELTHQLLKELIGELRIRRAVFILTNEGKIYGVMHEGASFPKTWDEQKVLAILSEKEIIVFDELPESPLKETMRALDFTVIMKLKAEGREIGLLALGTKLSGEIFLANDYELLKIFAPEAAVAIQNAKAYEEISRFNKKLRIEIDRATKNLQNANTRLKELDKLKTEFVSLASHELRTPMTAIKSYLWMALDNRGGALTEKQRYYIGRAYDSTDRLIKLVNDMLNISRIESGRLTLELQGVRLDQLAKEVQEDVGPRSQEVGVSVKVETPETLPPVLADPDKIKEVLFNLIGNSLKFTPKDGIITVSLSQQHGFIQVAVHDTGVGLAAEDIAKLFQKFALIEGSYTQNQAAQGTGLGLYISKSIIEMQHGKIWAESTGKGKGATFTFTLPIYTQEAFDQYAATKKSTEKTIGLVHTEI